MSGAWRLNRSLHRDVGYAVCVLTVVYAASGLAVNHTDAWNPTYAIRTDRLVVAPFDPTDLDTAEATLVAASGVAPDLVRGRHLVSPGELKVFLDEGGEIVVDPRSGQGTVERVTPRPFLARANALHLNRLKGAWTWFADAYALLLLYLAVGGLFMLRGPAGLGGRGKWLVTAGAVVPLGFWFLVR